MATSICISSEDFPEVTYSERLGGNTGEVAALVLYHPESLSPGSWPEQATYLWLQLEVPGATEKK